MVWFVLGWFGLVLVLPAMACGRMQSHAMADLSMPEQKRTSQPGNRFRSLLSMRSQLPGAVLQSGFYHKRPQNRFCRVLISGI